MDTDLVNADASFWGEEAGDKSGYSVAGAGDVNGDGYDDLLIGAYYNYGSYIRAGQTYLIFGKGTGWAMDMDLANADASFRGEVWSDYSGFSVAGAGDVNGDGYDDILIGAWGNDDGGTMAGQTYLILGKASGWAMNTSLSNADASFIGEYGSDQSGCSVSGAGDVNGDGYDDILIGAYGYVGGGKTYLILGKASGWSMDLDLYFAAISFVAEDSSDYAGYSVAGAGDVNGDGYDDILIGAYYDEDGGNGAGQTYLILGKTTGWTQNLFLSSADASFWGEDSDDYSGMSVAGAGDVNGDGYDDILIGAYLDDDGGSAAGQTYLILGNASGWAMDTDLSTADASFWGESTDDYSGSSVSGTGDVNGDGYDDILIGAYGNSENGSQAGQTYLILGKASGWAMDDDLSNADASFLGEDSGDMSGFSVAGAGDVNGDGHDDILIGAYGDDDGGGLAGQTYVLFPTLNFPPYPITSVKAYSDDIFSTEISTCYVNDSIYIELIGTDGNPTTKDKAFVNVHSDISNPTGFFIGLNETGKNTGTYRGNFTVKDKTHEGYRWIEANAGERVIVRSVQEPSKKVTVNVINPVILMPAEDNRIAIEDNQYSQQYWTQSVPDLVWTFETNATWLGWDGVTHTLSGTPDNSDVGNYWVRLNVSLDAWHYDEHNFTLSVNNTPPEIVTDDIVETFEDMNYYVDYNCSDDGQGEITWELDTNAGNWLSLESSTGNLSGTPTNDDVGEYEVKISVHDGNGGWDWSNFTLTVRNTNDWPFMVGDDITDAYEDSVYTLSYDVFDNDVDDVKFEWALNTNASWLDIDDTNSFTGTPSNDDVGTFDVNISVTDGNFGYDYREFVLTVHNVNDPPMWTNVPVSTNLTAGETYSFDVNAIDVDSGDRLTYALKGDSRAIATIDIDTGLIVWETTEDDVGVHIFNLSATDGDVTIFHDFTLEVLTNITNVVPTSTLISPENDEKLDILNPTFTWTVEDGDGDAVTSDLYIGTSMAPIESLDAFTRIAEDVEGTWYTPTIFLEKGKTYFWTVIPHDGTDVGVCTSGVWTFTVYYFPEFIDVTVWEGELVSVTIPSPEHETGPFDFSRIEGPDNAEVDSHGLVTWQTVKGDAGIHEIVVKVTIEDFVKRVTVRVVVEKDYVEGSLESGGKKMDITVLFIIIVIITAIVAILLLLKNRKRRAGEREDMEEIVAKVEPEIFAPQQSKAIGPVLDIPAYEKNINGITAAPAPLGLPPQPGISETLLLPAVGHQPGTPTPISPPSPEAVQQPVIITTTPLRPPEPVQPQKIQTATPPSPPAPPPPSASLPPPPEHPSKDTPCGSP